MTFTAGTDLAGNTIASTPQSTPQQNDTFTIDNTPPEMSITAKNPSDTTVTSGSSTGDATLTLTFNAGESTSDFAQDDIDLSGGTLSNFTPVSGPATSYTATFTPTDDGNDKSCTISVDTGKYTDAAGNSNTSGSFSWTFLVPPFMTITATEPGVEAPYNIIDSAEPVFAPDMSLQFVSNKSTADFTKSDITLTYTDTGGNSNNGNGEITDFAGSGTTYTASVKAKRTTDPAGNSVPSEGTYVIKVLAGTYTSSGVSNIFKDSDSSFFIYIGYHKTNNDNYCRR